MGEPHPIEGDVYEALETINVPSFVLDRTGIIRWLNPAAQALVGDARGRQFTSVLAPEEARRGREVFARNLADPGKAHDSDTVLMGSDGDRIGVEVSSVPLVEGGHVVGVFGQVADVEEVPPPMPHPHLTPRQTEVLALLERGRSTKDIARELHLSIETVRNHIRHILAALEVHSRIEAVTLAHRLRIVPA